MALKRLGDIYHVHSDSSVMVILYLYAVATSNRFYLNTVGLELRAPSGIFHTL